MYILRDNSQSARESQLTPTEIPAQKFCSYWHPWDYIQAQVPPPGQKPAWERVTDYPLEPRPLFNKWRSPAQLIGASFGNTTTYCLLDIDSSSQYHPQNSQEAFELLLSCLEDIGLVRPLIIQSSDSGGLHIYFPLARLVKTFALANLLVKTLEGAGFNVASGQLETFPNPKTWKPEGQGISLYKAHRLPLQQSSYLLDRALNPQDSSLEQFLSQWEQAATGQDQESLEQAIATTKIRRVTPINQPRSRKAEDWYQESQAIIAEGFTGFGQTNALIKKVGEFGRVFMGEVELAGETLLRYMVETIKSCPGYQQFCRHKHEIEKRCRHWLPLVEKWYSRYRSHPSRPRVGLTNEERSQAAQARIKAAVTELEASNSLPLSTRRRYEAIVPYGISKETLYKYKHLWHPEHYKTSVLPLAEPTSAISEELPKTSKPLSDELVRTPPIRSLLPPEVPIPELEIHLSEHEPPRGSLNGTSVTPTDTFVDLLEDLTGEPEPLQEGISPPHLNIDGSTATGTFTQPLSQDNVLPPSLQLPALGLQSSLNEQAEFDEWFDLAYQLGIVIDSEIEAGQFWVLTVAESWQPWVEMSAMFTPRRLRKMLEPEPE